MVWWSCLLGLIAIGIWCTHKNGHRAALQLSSSETISTYKFWHYLSLASHYLAIIMISWAVVHWIIGSGPLYRSSPPSFAQAKSLFFLVDQSGSMGEPLPSDSSVTKIAAVRRGLAKCIHELPDNTLIGLIAFARAAIIESPLSFDREFLLKAIDAISPQSNDELNGTAIGYAIFKSLYLIEACREFAQSKSIEGPLGNTIVLVTDGIEDPHPEDRASSVRSMRVLQALQYAQELNVRVYYVHVDPNSYRLLRPSEKAELLDAIAKTKGKYFEVSASQSIAQIVQQIASAEAEQGVDVPQDNRSFIGYWCIALAICACSFSRWIETALMRVVR